MFQFLKRLKEPSTHAGIAALVTVATVVGVPSTTAQAVGGALVGLCGLLAIFVPEQGA